MATRTQKAAMKTKAASAKAAPKAKPAKPAKATPGKAPKPAAKPSGKPSPKTVKPAGKAAAKAEPFDPIPEPKPTLGERFWHRIGLGAKAKEERAHQLAIEHEAALQLKIEQDRRDRERAEEDARAARKAHSAAERQANAKAAREMARLAREEDARLKREAEEAEARAAAQAVEERKAAAAARREEARQAKLEAAAEAQRLEEETAAEAARVADAKAAAQAQAAEERAAKRREAAEARREKARQDALAAEAKAEERRLARQRKAEEKAREDELAQLESEARSRRSAPKMDVTIREKDDEVVEMEELVEGEPVEVPDDGAAPDDEGPDAVDAPEEVQVVEPVFYAKETEIEEVDEEDAPAAQPVAAKGANGKASPPSPASELESQADRVAEELRSRRSKPITIDADDVPAPTLPVGRKARGEPEEAKHVLQLDPAPPARIEAAAPRGLSIPEHFLLLALEDVWDERRERATSGNLGGALVGALLLELVLQDKIRVQRDRFQVTEAAVDDAASAVVQIIKPLQDRPSLQVMGALAKELPELLPPYKARMAARGLIEHRAWRHLGMFYRSQTALVDEDAQERLRSKLARAIAGGGRPDAPTILSLGLLEASGLFGVVVPEGAQAYNRKRLNGLLAGKDVMGYKVDDELKAMQEMAIRTILDNVRQMTR